MYRDKNFVPDLNILEKDANRTSASLGKFNETDVVSNLAEYRKLS